MEKYYYGFVINYRVNFEWTEKLIIKNRNGERV